MTHPDHPTLLLLHGLGATGGVWSGVLAELDWPARTIAPDLPGHGSSPWTTDYELGALASAVAVHLGEGEPTLVVGHSLGGAIGIELASGRYRPNVIGVIGIGIKTTWTEDDVAGMAKVASRGVRWFSSRAEAELRYLRQAGLEGVIEVEPNDPTHPVLAGAVTNAPPPTGGEPSAGKWRVAQDPATFAQKPLGMAGLMAAAQCPVVLAAGEYDAMATRDELAHFSDEPNIASGRGHNVHVEDPVWVASLISDLVARLRGG